MLLQKISTLSRRSMAETKAYMDRVIFGERFMRRKQVSGRNEVLSREICNNVKLSAECAGSCL